VRQRGDYAGGVSDQESLAEAGRQARRNGLEAAELETALRQAPTATHSGKSNESSAEPKATRRASPDGEEYVEVVERKRPVKETKGK
jgi:hypothetical protein